MRATPLLFCPLLLLLLSHSPASAVNPNHPLAQNQTSIKDQIIAFVFNGYKNHERPVEGIDEATRVMVYMKILAIASVDVINMEYTVDMYLRQKWRDPRLSWNKIHQFKHYTKSIDIPSKKDQLWLPDLFFRNGKRGYMHKMTVPNHLLRLDPDGQILFSQKVTMIFACQMQLHTFPMDIQYCDMNIGSYGYTKEQLTFYWKSQDPVALQEKMQISEFDTPVQVICRDCSNKAATSTGRYTCLYARFELQRQLGSYLAGTYIPAFLTIMVSWLSFWVSVEAVPARITLGLLTLLGILTQSANVMSNLPRVSYIKALDIWIIACIMFIIGALVEFAIASVLARKQRQLEWQNQIRTIVRQELVKMGVLQINNNSRVHGQGEELETLLTTQMEDVKNGDGQIESEIDAYSRFLFPATFILYNCFYWLYYLVLVNRMNIDD